MSGLYVYCDSNAYSYIIALPDHAYGNEMRIDAHYDAYMNCIRVAFLLGPFVNMTSVSAGILSSVPLPDVANRVFETWGKDMPGELFHYLNSTHAVTAVYTADTLSPAFTTMKMLDNIRPAVLGAIECLLANVAQYTGAWDGMFKTPPKSANITPPTNVLSTLSDMLPDLHRVKKDCPVTPCLGYGTLSLLIIHLNDDHQWPREAVADWLDSLDVDLSFPTPDERITTA